MSGDTEPPGDRADDRRDTVDGYLLFGDENIVLVRPWKHGEQSGYTILKIFAQTSGFRDLEELSACGELFPELSSESIAEELVRGALVKLDCPVPVPVPPGPRKTKEERREAARRRQEAEERDREARLAPMREAQEGRSRLSSVPDAHL